MTACPSQSANPPDSGTGHNYAMRANLAEMPALAAWVDAVNAAIDVSRSRAYAVQLCLEELVVNVILHGVSTASGPIDVAICIRPNGQALEVVVEDNGAPFDPTQAASPGVPEDLSAASIGGRGLMLVRGFAQSLSYSRVGERNRVVLGFTD